jgi:AbrB family looped-hinge helix DNA binding protein
MAKVTSKLQVTIPKAVADRLGLKPGDDIDWRVEGDGARVEPARTAHGVSVEERLRIFDESTKRQEARDAEWRRTHSGAKPPKHRGWTRAELYTRGRAR